MFTQIIDTIFGAGLFVNALLFIPQAIRIMKAKQARDLSITTFIGFSLLQLIATSYGWVHHDYILMIGYFLSLVTCGFVTCLVIYYKILELIKK
jgi:MtN3 and saliva related transmembrane protein